MQFKQKGITKAGLYASQGQLSDKFLDPSVSDSMGHLYMAREDAAGCMRTPDLKGAAEAGDL